MEDEKSETAIATRIFRVARVVILSLLLLPLGGCGFLHGSLVRDLGLGSSPAPPGGKRLQADNLWTVMWNQKTFDTRVSSPMSVADTRAFYVQYLRARGWGIDWDRPPASAEDDSFISFQRGTPWESWIRWDYQSLDLLIVPTSDGHSIVSFHDTFEYAPLTWPRYLVVQGLQPLALPLIPLGESLGQAICMPVVAAVVILF